MMQVQNQTTSKVIPGKSAVNSTEISKDLAFN